MKAAAWLGNSCRSRSGYKFSRPPAGVEQSPIVNFKGAVMLNTLLVRLNRNVDKDAITKTPLRLNADSYTRRFLRSPPD